ncbi:TRAP transporter small permease [Salibacterium aidingense]|uniref:TRAP transporter small permease n=1 Tax=Salibacterium aidingense TaxID=384933 RepID=UPI0003FEB376|nr:TRAP transporter small permease [Salibacterium aidingense]
MLNKIKTFISRIVMIVASILTVIMVAGAFWQVFTRYVLGDPSVYTEELLKFLLIWVALLGAAYAFSVNEHLAIVFLKNKWKDKKALALQWLIDGLVIAFCIAVLILGGWDLSNSTMGQSTPILNIPMGWVYMILPISGCLIIFFQLVNMSERKNELENREQNAQTEGEVIRE